MTLYDVRSICLNFQMANSPNGRRPIASEGPRSIRAIHKKRKAEKEKANVQKRMIASVLSKVEDKTNRRDQDISNMQDLPWEHMTIPGSLSIRVPPSSIGAGSEKKNNFVGITNHDASRRYMSQLQKDRERNNKAVHRVLDNLPIKIRQMTQDSSSPEPGLYSVRDPGPYRVQHGEILYPEHLEHVPPTYESKLAAINSCFHPLVGCKVCRKCSRLRRKRENKKIDTKRELTSPLGTFRSNRSIKSLRDVFNSYNSSISHSEITHTARENTSHINSGGFQGYPVRSKNIMRVAKKRTQAFGHSIHDEDDVFRKERNKMELKTKYPFATSTLITGHKIGNVKLKKHKKLPPINAKEDSDKEEVPHVITIPSVRKLTENSLSSTSENQEYVESPEPLPVVPMHSFASDVSISHMISNISSQNLENVVLHGKQLSLERTIEDDTAQTMRSPIMIPVADEDSFGIDYQETSPNLSMKMNADNLTDISEHEENSITKTERSEEARDVKLSVHIQFRQKEQETLHEESKNSETVTMPRWIENEVRGDTNEINDHSIAISNENSSIKDLKNKFEELKIDESCRSTYHTCDTPILSSQEPTLIGSTSRLQTTFIEKSGNNIHFIRSDTSFATERTNLEVDPQLEIQPSNSSNDEITYSDNMLRSDTKEVGDVQYIVHRLSKETSIESVVNNIEDAQDLAFTAHLNST